LAPASSGAILADWATFGRQLNMTIPIANL
jgi:hypothetical protein